MKQLIDVVDYAIKGDVKNNGVQYVLIEHKGKRHTRKIYYKYFSNYPIEYIKFDNKDYQVNTVKSLY